jgi:hypothetical protein
MAPPPRRRYSIAFLQPSHVQDVLGELATFDYWLRIEGGGLPWPVLVRLGRSEGRLVITGLIVGAGEDHPAEITSRGLRLVTVPEITAGIARMAKGDPILEDLFLDTAPPYRRPRRRPGQVRLPREHFEAVARSYREGVLAGWRSPVAKVASDFHVGSTQARRYVARARDMGILGPAPKGRAGEIERSES